MVVVAVAHLFVAGAALAEVVPLDDAGVLEQLDGPVYRRDRDLVVDRDAAAIQFLDVGMIRRLRQHACDDAALLGHAHPGGGAAGFDTGGLERGRGFQCGHRVSPRLTRPVVPLRRLDDKSRRSTVRTRRRARCPRCVSSRLRDRPRPRWLASTAIDNISASSAAMRDTAKPMIFRPSLRRWTSVFRSVSMLS